MPTYVRDNNGWFDGSIGDGRKPPVTVSPAIKSAFDEDAPSTESLSSVFETFEDVRRWKAARFDGLKARALHYELEALALQVQSAEAAHDLSALDLFRGRFDAISAQASTVFARVGVDGAHGPAAAAADRIEASIMPVFHDVAARLASGTPANDLSDSERLIYNSVTAYRKEAERVAQMYPDASTSLPV